MGNKWRVDHGIHRGTITSRDRSSQEYDTEQEARAAFQKGKTFYVSMGYHIWYAYLIAPDETKTALDPGNSNYR